MYLLGLVHFKGPLEAVGYEFIVMPGYSSVAFYGSIQLLSKVNEKMG